MRGKKEEVKKKVLPGWKAGREGDPEGDPEELAADLEDFCTKIKGVCL